MDYGRCMGYGSKFPVNRLGSRENVWVIGDYGLRGLWVKRDSTVYHISEWCQSGVETSICVSIAFQGSSGDRSTPIQKYEPRKEGSVLHGTVPREERRVQGIRNRRWLLSPVLLTQTWPISRCNDQGRTRNGSLRKLSTYCSSTCVDKST